MKHSGRSRTYPVRAVLSAWLMLTATVWAAEVPPVHNAELVQTFDASNARQAIAVDARHFYVVNNYAIVKHDKATGKIVARWSGPAEGDPLIHLDSLVELDGRLYAAHSNYPVTPMTSSVEIWDAETMQHTGSHSFGIYRGSFTWLDRHGGYWWGAFANYDKVQPGEAGAYGQTNNTQVVKFDDDFRVLQAWTLPLAILDRMRPMSNSGGSWGPDGMLYLTGHDRGEIYVMQVPAAGSTLDWVATVTVPVVEGQGIAWDRSARGRYLWGINKAERKAVKAKMPVIDIR
jgi:hypothetical protein